MRPQSPPPTAPVETESLSEWAYVRLREAIAAGRLTPGTKLSERGLATRLGISAQPIREALHRLEAEGMVETRPRSGTFVAALDVERLKEMGRIRSALEGVAAALAARRASPAGIAGLHAAEKAILAADDDPVALADANDRLHCCLHQLSGSVFLIRNLQMLRAYLHIGSGRVLPSRAQRELATQEHIAIVAAVTAGEADRAETLMRAHTLRSLQVAFPEPPPAHRPDASPQRSMTETLS